MDDDLSSEFGGFDFPDQLPTFSSQPKAFNKTTLESGDADGTSQASVLAAPSSSSRLNGKKKDRKKTDKKKNLEFPSSHDTVDLIAKKKKKKKKKHKAGQRETLDSTPTGGQDGNLQLAKSPPSIQQTIAPQEITNTKADEAAPVEKANRNTTIIAESPPTSRKHPLGHSDERPSQRRKLQHSRSSSVELGDLRGGTAEEELQLAIQETQDDLKSRQLQRLSALSPSPDIRHPQDAEPSLPGPGLWTTVNAKKSGLSNLPAPTEGMPESTEPAGGVHAESPSVGRRRRSLQKQLTKSSDSKTKTKLATTSTRQLLAELPLQDAEETEFQPRKTPQVRKSKMREMMRAESTNDLVANASSGLVPSQPLPNRVSKKKKKSFGYLQGRFSDEEHEQIAEAVERFRSDNKLSQLEVIALIQERGASANSRCAELWENITKSCPDRERQKIINQTRKRFHNFVARGTWTAEQEQELEELIEKYGAGNWAKIAGFVNRHPEDVRDRYRNYIICGKTMKRDAWGDEEEKILVQSVATAMDRLDQSDKSKRNLLGTGKSYEELIDWGTMSENMGRTRSRLQCQNKWKSLNLDIAGEGRALGRQATVSVTESWRLRKARLQIKMMETNEKFLLVEAINKSAAGRDTTIPWHRLVDATFRMKWHRDTVSLLWRRLRSTLSNHEKKTVRDCSRRLLMLFDEEKEFQEPSESDINTDEEEEFLKSFVKGGLPAIQERRKTIATTHGVKSSEMVIDSGSDPEPEPEPEPELEPIASDNSSPVAGLSLDPIETSSPPKPGSRKRGHRDIEEDKTPRENSRTNSVAHSKEKGKGKGLKRSPAGHTKFLKNCLSSGSTGRKDRTGNPLPALSPLLLQTKQVNSIGDGASLSSDMDDMEDLPARL
jgi:hypothetical protein